MTLKVGQSYRCKEGYIIFIKEEQNGKFLGKNDCKTACNTWMTYDSSGKCLDYGYNGNLLNKFDLILEEYVPYTAETFPVDAFIKKKSVEGFSGTRISTLCGDKGVKFSYMDRVYTFQELLDDFVTIGGRPMGRKV
mgnify:CR=1 FL=1